jgi:hypothetical protein
MTDGANAGMSLGGSRRNAWNASTGSSSAAERRRGIIVRAALADAAVAGEAAQLGVDLLAVGGIAGGCRLGDGRGAQRQGEEAAGRDKAA